MTIGVTGSTDDYLGTGKSEPAVFRRASTGRDCLVRQGGPSAHRNRQAPLSGSSTLDVPLTGDFDGDGNADLAVYRPSTAQWFVAGSATSYTGRLLATFGAANLDLPAPAAYTGGDTTVPGVYRPTTGQWFIYEGGAGKNITVPHLFPTGATPVPGNYNNTGKDEPATYANSVWTIDGPAGLYTIRFGAASDIPVPGAYDATATDPAVEPAVWRPSTGRYFILGPGGIGRVLQFQVGDVPAPGDYDGNGVTEAAVYRPSTGQWFVMGPNDKSPRLVATYGGRLDVPPIAPYVYRKPSGGIHAAAVSLDSSTARPGFATLIPVDLTTSSASASLAVSRPAVLSTAVPSGPPALIARPPAPRHRDSGPERVRSLETAKVHPISNSSRLKVVGAIEKRFAKRLALSMSRG